MYERNSDDGLRIRAFVTGSSAYMQTQLPETEIPAPWEPLGYGSLQSEFLFRDAVDLVNSLSQLGYHKT
jgi:hypothetical protein